jgi:DNA-binding PadR family transcriptional regulator
MDEIEVKALEYLPLTESTFAILVALAEPRHGYGIMQAVAQADGGGIRLGPGTLYGALTKLLEGGLIARAGDSNTGDERRKLYVLTPLGRRVVRLESERLDRMARLGRLVITQWEEDDDADPARV